MTAGFGPPARPIAGGIHDNHNGGSTAVRGGRAVLYSEWQCHTRGKKQAGWWPNLTIEQLRRLPVSGAISSLRPAVMRAPFHDRLDGRSRADGRVVLRRPPVRLLEQAGLHPAMHFMSVLLLADVQPGSHRVIIFDAGRLQIGWADLRRPRHAIPHLDLTARLGNPWCALARNDLPRPISVSDAGGGTLSLVSKETIRCIAGLPLVVPPFSHDAGQFVGAAVHETTPALLHADADPEPAPLLIDLNA